jgi:pyrroline-5-carboxylate reductase
MKIGFIGFGHMAKAIANSLSSHDHTLFASAPSLSPGLSEQGIHTHHDNLKIIEKVDTIILAVKPKNLKLVWEEIKNKISPHQLVITIAAGVSLNWFEKPTGSGSVIIRAMPNIAVSICQGVTTLFAGPRATEQQKRRAQQIFSHSGITVWLEDESDMDVCTSLSGSGPAYIFLFMEAIIHAACKLGLGEDLAKLLTVHTFQGALALVQQSNSTPEELRKQVTSPGGTTAAALEIFQKHEISEIIESAMQAAYERAQQLEKSLHQKQ